MTMMLGGVIGGYCAIGNVKTAIPPARVMTMDSTAAKIGRSMKKRENTMEPQAPHYFPGVGADWVTAVLLVIRGGLALATGCGSTVLGWTSVPSLLMRWSPRS